MLAAPASRPTETSETSETPETPEISWVYACVSEEQWSAAAWGSPAVFTADVDLAFYEELKTAVSHALWDSAREVASEIVTVLQTLNKKPPKRRSSSTNGLAPLDDVAGALQDDQTDVGQVVMDPEAKVAAMVEKVLAGKWTLVRAPYDRAKFPMRRPDGSQHKSFVLDDDYIAVDPRAQHVSLGVFGGPFAAPEWGLVTGHAERVYQQHCAKIARERQAAAASRVQKADEEVAALEAELEAAKRRRLHAQSSV
jgi:hypothetical protein